MYMLSHQGRLLGYPGGKGPEVKKHLRPVGKKRKTDSSRLSSCIFGFQNRDDVEVIGKRIKYCNLDCMIQALPMNTYKLQDVPIGTLLVKPVMKIAMDVRMIELDEARVMANVNGTNVCLIDHISPEDDCVIMRGAVLDSRSNNGQGHDAVDYESIRWHLMNSFMGTPTSYEEIKNKKNQQIIILSPDMLDIDDDILDF